MSWELIFPKQTQKSSISRFKGEGFAGAYSRRIIIQHRLVYQVLEADKPVKILRMWTHYELTEIHCQIYEKHTLLS